jgi:hypothetical protein
MSETTLFYKLFSHVKPKQKVLFLWQGVEVPANFQDTVNRLQTLATDGKVVIEHSSRMSLADHERSSFDLIVVNCLTPDLPTSSSEALAGYLALLKPGGRLIEFGSETSKLESELKLSGFKGVEFEESDGIVVYLAEKPGFEVGAASKLKFGAKKVWQFTEDDINEDDLINTDDLLDDADLKKPTIDSRDCGTSKEGWFEVFFLILGYSYFLKLNLF